MPLLTCLLTDPIQSQSYETLKITYESVTSIDMNQGISGTDVRIKLSSPAWVGQALINVPGKLEATFLIKTEDMKRFKTALGARGLVRASLPIPLSPTYHSL